MNALDYNDIEKTPNVFIWRKKESSEKNGKNYGFSFIRSNVYCTILHIMKHFG